MNAPATQASDKRRFHMLGCLGRGGFGEVYLAQMTSAGGVRSRVAVKVLHEGLDPRSQAVQRLRDEGRLLGVLHHPNILRVSDLVLLDGRVALVTEYVEGADLDHCFRGDDPIPTRALLEAVGRVADALDAAWNTPSPDGGPLRLIHRDIKPSNIRIGRHGDLKLLDFGIAKASNLVREAKTQTDAVIGSFLYMAPERFDTDSARPASDVYALGCTLYEGLAGSPPWADLDVREQYVLSLDPQRHDSQVDQRLDRLDGVPRDVIDLLRDLLAHAPGDRPAAWEVSTRCDALVDALPGRGLRRWCRQHAWPPPHTIGGELDGQVITESSFTASGVHTAKGPATTWQRSTPPREGSSRGLLLPVLALAAVAAVLLLAGGGAVAWLALHGGADAPESPAADATAADDPTPAPADPEPSVTGPEQPATDPAQSATDPQPPTNGSGRSAPTHPAPEARRTAEAGAHAAAAPADPAPMAPPPIPAPTTRPPAPSTPAPPTPSEPEPAMVLFGGKVPVELRRDGEAHLPGRVPAGTYEVWADFGTGWTDAGSLDLDAGHATTLTCSRLRRDCRGDR